MQKNIHEIYWIRALACLSVVLIHALSRTIYAYELSKETIQFIQSFKMLLMFATPMFVLISEVLLANVYPNQLPKGFFKKRIKYILLPYILIPFLYGLFYYIFKDFTLQNVVLLLQKYILQASWHGYFIVIIFQFYFLHLFYIKFLNRISIWAVLLGSLVINTGYLYFVNFVTPEWLSPIILYFKLPFLGWLFYFSLAFYVGKYLDTIRQKITAWIPIILAGWIGSIVIMIFFYLSGELTRVSSARIDVMFYTSFLFFILLYLFKELPKVPSIVLIIGKYSFSIYLLHVLMFEIAKLILPEVHVVLYPMILFLVGVIGSILMAKLMAKLPFSEYVIGKLRPIPKLQPKNDIKKDSLVS